MTATPGIWRADTVAGTVVPIDNDGFLRPSSAGLAGGGFVVSWYDAAHDIYYDVTNGDVTARNFDALGNPLGTPYRANTLTTVGYQASPDVIGLLDGGYIVAYHNSYIQGVGGLNKISFERYDKAGSFLAANEIEVGSWDTQQYTNPSLALLPNGSVIVSYETRTGGGSPGAYDVYFRIIDTVSNSVSGRMQAGENSLDNDTFPRSAVLKNGNVAIAYEEVDSAVKTADFRVTTANGDLVATGQVSAAGKEPDIAALTGGGFAMVWTARGVDDNIVARVFGNDGTPLGIADILVATGVGKQDEPQIVALKDGGFYVAWDNDATDTLEGARYSATGQLLGAVQPLASYPGAGDDIRTPDLTLLSDGRILVTYARHELDIRTIILDPRDGPINGTVNADFLTGLAKGGKVFAKDGADTIVGGDGADLINGGGGKDDINGAAGNDIADYSDKTKSVDVTIKASGATVKIGGKAEDTIHNVEGIAGGSAADDITGDGLANLLRGGGGKDHLDGGKGIDAADYSDKTKNVEVTLKASGATVKVDGKAEDTIKNIESLIGGSKNDKLTGDAKANSLDGGKGDDVIGGKGGNDSLTGGIGKDVLTGGAGGDTFVFNATPSAKNVDTIKDFEHGKDTIHFDGVAYESIGPTLDAGEFVKGKAAADLDDHVIYDKSSGKLFLDADGLGGADQQLVAILTSKPVLDAGDFG